MINCVRSWLRQVSFENARPLIFVAVQAALYILAIALLALNPGATTDKAVLYTFKIAFLFGVTDYEPNTHVLDQAHAMIVVVVNILIAPRLWLHFRAAVKSDAIARLLRAKGVSPDGMLFTSYDRFTVPNFMHASNGHFYINGARYKKAQLRGHSLHRAQGNVAGIFAGENNFLRVVTTERTEFLECGSKGGRERASRVGAYLSGLGCR